jgi:hypothetical protein
VTARFHRGHPPWIHAALLGHGRQHQTSSSRGGSIAMPDEESDANGTQRLVRQRTQGDARLPQPSGEAPAMRVTVKHLVLRSLRPPSSAACQDVVWTWSRQRSPPRRRARRRAEVLSCASRPPPPPSEGSGRRRDGIRPAPNPPRRGFRIRDPH